MCSDINNRQNRSKSIFIQLLTLTWVAALLVSCGSNLPSTTQPTFEATESAPGPSEPATMETQEPAAPEMSSMEGDTALPDVHSLVFRAWVRERVEQARQYFREGKRYLDKLDVLRCKIAGYWYIVRSEVVLDAIERDAYILRAECNERRSLSTWLKMVWLSITVTCRHLARQGLRVDWWRHRQMELDSSNIALSTQEGARMYTHHRG